MQASVCYQTGLAAEDLAARLYASRAGRIVSRRERTRSGEIDLIVECGGQTIFVEVKSRRTLDLAAYALSPKQARRIGSAAQEWLAAQGRSEDAIRFDVVLVDRAGRAEILENALSFDGM